MRTIARGLIRAQIADKENYYPLYGEDGPEGATLHHSYRSKKVVDAFTKNLKAGAHQGTKTVGPDY